MVEVPLWVDETYPLTLSYTPAVVPVTVTLKVQLPPAVSDPPVSAIVLVPAVVVSVPPHCGVEFVAISRPAGKTSVKATPVNA